MKGGWKHRIGGLPTHHGSALGKWTSYPEHALAPQHFRMEK